MTINFQTGSGLGLWISSGIVDLHGGKITVNSGGEGLGSSFTVEIPMHRLPSCDNLQEEQEEQGQEAEQEAEQKEKQEPGLKDFNHTADVIQTIPEAADRNEENFDRKHDKMPSSQSLSESTLPPRAASFSCPPLKPGNMGYDVLVVDDSRLNRKMLLKFLLKNGNVCTEAEDGLEAIERVKERIDFANGSCGKPYDAILMDFIMPNMDGPTATKHLRSMGYTGLIFGVTGNGKHGCEE